MSPLDLVLWFLVLGAETAMIVLLVRTRVVRLFPAFTFYLCWTILSDLPGIASRTQFPAWYLQFYFYETVLDTALQFVVLVELAWSVLRPVRSSLPRWSIFAVALLILLMAAAMWPLAGISQLQELTPQWRLLLHIQQSSAIMRILFFMVLAAGSQLFSLGWRDRELQIATGLGFYSLISLGAQIFHAQVPTAKHYHWVDQTVTASYLCSLTYWLLSFMQKEAPRHEFTPQMESFLLKMSGAARTNRIALENRTLPRDRQT